MTDKMIVIAAPSGAGKNTFIDKALDVFKELNDITTYTTRAMRAGESPGHPYHFISEERFKDLIEQDFFVEWAKVHVYHYGTSWDEILGAWKKNQTAIMDVDVQGAQTFRKKFPQCLSIFIEPPSLEVLKARIEKRDGGLPADIDVRMESARKEMLRAQEFDHRIINDDFEKAFEDFRKLVGAYISS